MSATETGTKVSTGRPPPPPPHLDPSVPSPSTASAQRILGTDFVAAQGPPNQGPKQGPPTPPPKPSGIFQTFETDISGVFKSVGNDISSAGKAIDRGAGAAVNAVIRTPVTDVNVGSNLVLQSEGQPKSVQGFGKFLAGETLVAGGGLISFLNPNALKFDTKHPEIIGAEAVGLGVGFVGGSEVLGGFETATGIARLGQLGTAGRLFQGGLRFGYGGALSAGQAVLSGHNPLEGGIEGGLIFAVSPYAVGGAKAVGSSILDRVFATDQSSQRFLGQLAESYGFPNTKQGISSFLEAVKSNPDQEPFEFGTPDPYKVPTNPFRTGNEIGGGNEGPPSRGGGTRNNFYNQIRQNAVELGTGEEYQGTSYYRNVIKQRLQDYSTGESTSESSSGQQTVQVKNPVEEVVTSNQSATESMSSSYDDAVKQFGGEAQSRIAASRAIARGGYNDPFYTFLATPPSFVSLGGPTRPSQASNQGLGLGTVVDINKIVDVTKIVNITDIVDITQVTKVVDVVDITQITDVQVKTITDVVDITKVELVIEDVTAFDLFQVQAIDFAQVSRGLNYPMRVPTKTKRGRRRKTRDTEFVRPHQISLNILAENPLAGLDGILF